MSEQTFSLVEFKLHFRLVRSCELGKRRKNWMGQDQRKEKKVIVRDFVVTSGTRSVSFFVTSYLIRA